MKRSKIMISLLILFVAFVFVSCKSKVGSCPKFDGNDQVQYDGNGLVKKRK